MTDTTTENETKRCTFCDELIRLKAVVCPYCSRELAGGMRGQVRMADRSTQLGIAVLMFIVLIQLIILLIEAMQ